MSEERRRDFHYEPIVRRGVFGYIVGWLDRLIKWTLKL